MADKYTALNRIEERRKWIIEDAKEIDTDEETATAAQLDEKFTQLLTHLSLMHRYIIEVSDAEWQESQREKESKNETL